MYGRFSRPTLGLAVAVSLGLGVVLGLGSVPDGSRFRSAWPDTTAYMELRLEEARARSDIIWSSGTGPFRATVSPGTSAVPCA